MHAKPIEPKFSEIMDGENMQDQDIKLPLSKPLVRGYLHHAYQFSVLGNYEIAKPWIFTNFIQLFSENGNLTHPIQFYLPDHNGYNWSVIAHCFDLQIINRSFILQKGLRLSDIIQSAIQNGEYVLFYVNEKYIPDTYAGARKLDFNHMIMIHGFNANRNLAYFWGYDKTWNYRESSVDFDTLERAYLDNEYENVRYEQRLYLFKMNEMPKYHLSFQLQPIIQQLSDFRDSRRVVKNVIDYYKGVSYKYGLSAYDNLIAIMQSVLDDPEQNVWRNLLIPLHILMEHKTLMVERLKYIESQFPQLDLANQINNYTVLANAFEKLRNQILKYGVSRNTGILQSAIDKMKEIQKDEYQMLTDLINALSAAA
jgi:hypothetical protein